MRDVVERAMRGDREVFGALRYTVPAGWANDADWPTRFGLSLAPDFQRTSPASPDPSPRILVLTQAAAESQATPCSGSAQAGVVSSAVAVLGWLHRVPGLRMTGSGSLTIDGRQAPYVDLAIDATHAPRCGSDQQVEYLLSGTDGFGIGQGEVQRLILVDLGAGQLVAIRVEARDTASLEALFKAARSIIESFRFQ